MDLNNLPVFKMLTTKMRWLHERQSVLAHNVANADTPGYQAKDLDELNFQRVLDGSLEPKVGMSMAKTASSHYALKATADAPFDSKQSANRDQTPVGNSVNLEEQMIDMANTRMDYQMMTNLYRKHVSMLSMAIGKGGS